MSLSSRDDAEILPKYLELDTFASIHIDFSASVDPIELLDLLTLFCN